jgi:four helix bundle protein
LWVDVHFVFVFVFVLDFVLVLVFVQTLARVLHPPHFVHFRRLTVYQHAIQILPLAAEIASALPQSHANLADQLRRASVSIPLNIAEGSGKMTRPDQRRFFAIARGSAMECAAIVDACLALALVRSDRAAVANDLLASVVRMLSTMCRG